MDLRPDRWTVRGVPKETQRAALAAARAADRPLGPWLAELISTATAGSRPGDMGAIADRLARHEHILVDLLDRLAVLESDPGQ